MEPHLRLLSSRQSSMLTMITDLPFIYHCRWRDMVWFVVAPVDIFAVVSRGRGGK